MKILVPIKRVPDPSRKIRVTSDGRLDAAGISWIIDPYDEAALSHALGLRAEAGGEVVAVAAGQCLEQQIQAALALGADRAVHIQNADQSDLPRFAQLLGALFAREQADVCVVGKLTSDTEDPSLGFWLAKMSGVPQATSVLSIAPTGPNLFHDLPHLRVVCARASGSETRKLALPAVAAVELGTPLTLTLPAVLAARSKPVERIDGASLQPDASFWMRTLRYDPAPPRGPIRRVADARELASLLKEELRRLAPRPRVLDTDQENRTLRRLVYNGTVIETVQYSEAAARMLTNAGMRSPAAKQARSATDPMPRPSLTAARVAVVGGRALGTPGNFERLIGGLADALGGAVGATGGAVAAGLSTVDCQIGQSAMTIAPDLYIAAGISGADQHTGGMRGSKVIVAINSDPSAAIFRVADYALVGDLNDVLPELTARLSE